MPEILEGSALLKYIIWVYAAYVPGKVVFDQLKPGMVRAWNILKTNMNRELAAELSGLRSDFDDHLIDRRAHSD